MGRAGEEGVMGRAGGVLLLLFLFRSPPTPSPPPRPWWGYRGSRAAIFGLSLGPEGPCCGLLGTLLWLLGGILQPSWALLFPSRAFLGHLGALVSNRWAALRRLGPLRPSWAPQEALSSTLLGLSWSPAGGTQLHLGSWSKMLRDSVEVVQDASKTTERGNYRKLRAEKLKGLRRSSGRHTGGH